MSASVPDPSSPSSLPLDELLSSATDQQLAKWKAGAMSALGALMLSDAPLQVNEGVAQGTRGHRLGILNAANFTISLLSS